jgi:hypothetical protein
MPLWRAESDKTSGMGWVLACGVDPAATSIFRTYQAWLFLSDISSIWYLPEGRMLGTMVALI